jgi:hypothetical protein
LPPPTGSTVIERIAPIASASTGRMTRATANGTGVAFSISATVHSLPPSVLGERTP